MHYTGTRSLKNP